MSRFSLVSTFFSRFLLLFFFSYISFMASSMSLIPSSSEFTTLQEAYSLTPADGVEFLAAGVVIALPLPRKVGVYQKTFDVGLRLPLTGFQEQIL